MMDESSVYSPRRLRAWADPEEGRPRPLGKAQVAMVFLRNSGMDTLLEGGLYALCETR